jgi:hypothetical protein
MFENQDAFLLLNILRFWNAKRSSFLVANEMADTMPGRGWTRKRFAAARMVLLAHGHITLVRRASTARAALYAWGDPRGPANVDQC